MTVIPMDLDTYGVYFKDDPVRPHITGSFRTSDNRTSFALMRNGDEKPSAIICCAFCEDVPVDEKGLDKPGNVAVFYTIWSYAKGAGAELVNDVVDYIKDNYPEIKRFVTLSPQTKMAERFHIKNGAVVLQTNETTVNYEYEGV